MLTPTFKTVEWFLKNLKLNEKYDFAIAIVKDIDYNIPYNLLGNVFDLNSTDPYVIVLVGDREGYDVDGALKEMQSIIDLANSKYNLWKDLKLVPEIEKLQPSSRTFRAKWDAAWETCSYKYGRNDCLDAIMLGFFWSIVHGILYLICSFVMLISYPVLIIYDSCCSGLYTKLNKALEDNFSTGLYVPSNSIDNEITTTMTALANKLTTDESKPVKVSLSQRYPYIVAEPRTEDDEMVTHYADLFMLCFGKENHSDQALTVPLSMNAV